MRRHPKPISLFRETLRHLVAPEGSRPLAAFPTTALPDHCHTASCKPYIC
jgi:hypothetical protein